MAIFKSVQLWEQKRENAWNSQTSKSTITSWNFGIRIVFMKFSRSLFHRGQWRSSRCSPGITGRGNLLILATGPSYRERQQSSLAREPHQLWVVGLVGVNSNKGWEHASEFISPLSNYSLLEWSFLLLYHSHQWPATAESQRNSQPGTFCWNGKCWNTPQR